jgi:hypothetical protein
MSGIIERTDISDNNLIIGNIDFVSTSGNSDNSDTSCTFLKKCIYIYEYVQLFLDFEQFLKTYIVNDLKLIVDYKKKNYIRHCTYTYYDVVSKVFTSDVTNIKPCKPTYLVTR